MSLFFLFEFLTLSDRKRAQKFIYVAAQRAKRKGDWRRRTQGLGGTPPEHLQHTALISTREGQDHWGTRLPPHDFTLSPAKQRTVVSRQVERPAFETTGRNPLSRLLAHDPILTLPCTFAPTNDRDDMVSATSSGGDDSRFPIQQKHSTDATSNRTAKIHSQHPERQTPREPKLPGEECW